MVAAAATAEDKPGGTPPRSMPPPPQMPPQTSWRGGLRTRHRCRWRRRTDASAPRPSQLSASSLEAPASTPLEATADVVAVPDVFSVAKDAVADVKASAVRGRRVRRRRSAVATRSHGRRRVHGQKRRRRVRRRRCGGVPKPWPRQPPRLPRAHQNQTMQSPRPKQAGFRLGRQQHRRFRRTHL